MNGTIPVAAQASTIGELGLKFIGSDITGTSKGQAQPPLE
jgi:hypothetical protein